MNSMNVLSNDLASLGLNIQISIPCRELKDFFWAPKDGSLLIFGNGGKEFWSHASLPLDDFTKTQIIHWGKTHLKEDLTNNFFYPKDHLIIALQQLGRKLNLCAQSPIGIDIHPTFGLWFAFRAVVFTTQELPEMSLKPIQSPCDQCVEKACLEQETFRKQRLACPIGAHHRYSDEQLDYHESITSQLRF
jgi:hypothetical protein